MSRSYFFAPAGLRILLFRRQYRYIFSLHSWKPLRTPLVQFYITVSDCFEYRINTSVQHQAAFDGILHCAARTHCLQIRICFIDHIEPGFYRELSKRQIQLRKRYRESEGKSVAEEFCAEIISIFVDWELQNLQLLREANFPRFQTTSDGLLLRSERGANLNDPLSYTFRLVYFCHFDQRPALSADNAEQFSDKEKDAEWTKGTHCLWVQSQLYAMNLMINKVEKNKLMIFQNVVLAWFREYLLGLYRNLRMCSRTEAY